MTIEEQRKAIIEDAKAAGLYIGTFGNVSAKDGIKSLYEFAQLQAARNQSNNMPVAYKLEDAASGEKCAMLVDDPELRRFTDGNYVDRVILTKLYTSPQHSNALEMAAKVWKYQTRIKLSTASEWCALAEWMLTENWEAVQGVLDYAKKVNDFQVNYVAYAEIPQPESDGNDE
jgi:hypothetical protein